VFWGGTGRPGHRAFGALPADAVIRRDRRIEDAGCIRAEKSGWNPAAFCMSYFQNSNFGGNFRQIGMVFPTEAE